MTAEQRRRSTVTAPIRLLAVLQAWTTRAVDEERGDVVQWLAISAVCVVVIIAISKVMQQFGVDVFAWAGKQLGIS